jgi:hypothetical protein
VVASSGCILAAALVFFNVYKCVVLCGFQHTSRELLMCMCWLLTGWWQCVLGAGQGGARQECLCDAASFVHAALGAHGACWRLIVRFCVTVGVLHDSCFMMQAAHSNDVLLQVLGQTLWLWQMAGAAVFVCSPLLLCGFLVGRMLVLLLAFLCTLNASACKQAGGKAGCNLHARQRVTCGHKGLLSHSRAGGVLGLRCATGGDCTGLLWAHPMLCATTPARQPVMTVVLDTEMVAL